MQIFKLVFISLQLKINKQIFYVFHSLPNGVWNMVHMDVVFLTDLILSLKVR